MFSSLVFFTVMFVSLIFVQPEVSLLARATFVIEQDTTSMITSIILVIFFISSSFFSVFGLFVFRINGLFTLSA